MNGNLSEIKSGDRFGFGKNWTDFLSVLNDERIQVAEDSLKRMLGVESLSKMRFLDMGSGSGLFSLAARRLGAEVHSFDYDPVSVACAAELKRRYFDGDPLWVVEEGSALDKAYLAKLGQFDVVYSWGVLHHAGSMWEALENAGKLVGNNGRLFISIYNDQGLQSKIWRVIKKIYNKLPFALKNFFAILIMLPHQLAYFLWMTANGNPLGYFRKIINYSKQSNRGMSYYHDIIDWVGGYPFEVAKPEEIFEFFLAKGFILKKIKTCGGKLGCNEFVFSL